MNVQSVRVGRELRVVFSGSDALDTANAAAAKRGAIDAIGAAREIMVDLGAVEFVDSAGIGALVSIYKSVRQRGGRVRFCGLRPGVRSVLALIRLDRIFDIVEDEVECVPIRPAVAALAAVAGAAETPAGLTEPAGDGPPGTPRRTRR